MRTQITAILFTALASACAADSEGPRLPSAITPACVGPELAGVQEADCGPGREPTCFDPEGAHVPYCAGGEVVCDNGARPVCAAVASEPEPEDSCDPDYCLTHTCPPAIGQLCELDPEAHFVCACLR